MRSIRVRRNSVTRNGVSLYPKGFEATKSVNLVMKTVGTWGKRSSKTGDYGWLPNIWSGYRRQFRVGSDLPRGIYTTQRAALAYGIAYEAQCAQLLAEDIELETDTEILAELKDELIEANAQLEALKRRMKTLAKG